MFHCLVNWSILYTSHFRIFITVINSEVGTLRHMEFCFQYIVLRWKFFRTLKGQGFVPLDIAIKEEIYNPQSLSDSVF